jgi:hypothetical protein
VLYTDRITRIGSSRDWILNDTDMYDYVCFCWLSPLELSHLFSGVISASNNAGGQVRPKRLEPHWGSKRKMPTWPWPDPSVQLLVSLFHRSHPIHCDSMKHLCISVHICAFYSSLLLSYLIYPSIYLSAFLSACLCVQLSTVCRFLSFFLSIDLYLPICLF